MSSNGPYHIGDDWALEATVTNNKTGLPGEPGEVNIAIHKPDGTITHTKGTRVTEGVFTIPAIELNAAGRWLAIINTTAPFKGCQPVSITVLDPTTA